MTRDSTRGTISRHQRWRKRQPALLSKLRSSAKGLLRLLSALGMCHMRPNQLRHSESCQQKRTRSRKPQHPGPCYILCGTFCRRGYLATAVTSELVLRHEHDLHEVAGSKNLLENLLHILYCNSIESSLILCIVVDAILLMSLKSAEPE